MNPALKTYLGDCHAKTVRALILAEAVELLAEKGMAQHKVTGDLLAVLGGLLAELQSDLDLVNLPREEAA